MEKSDKDSRRVFKRLTASSLTRQRYAGGGQTKENVADVNVVLTPLFSFQLLMCLLFIIVTVLDN
jgi:hypothetical protein